MNSSKHQYCLFILVVSARWSQGIHFFLGGLVQKQVIGFRVWGRENTIYAWIESEVIPIWKISKHIERISNINFKMFLQFIIPYILIILLIRVYNMVVQAIQFNHGWSSDPQFLLANLSSSRYVIGAWIQNVIPQRWGKLGKYLGQTKWDILQLKIQQKHIIW